MKQLYLLLCLGLCASLFGQTLPPINSGILPNDTDAICSTPWYNNIDFDTVGYDVGDTVNDFTLFDLNGNAFQLSAALAQGKPVLLIAGNLTCPVFRNQLSDINTVVSAYASYITPMVVYGIEAHPTDTSPYSGTINVHNQNINQGILFPQPTTYLERKNLVDTLLQNYTINFPIVIDGPCNEVWHTYGPAPQNAYLIDTNGTVILKHGWFHQYPNNIFCDLDSILGVTLPHCTSTSASGSFILNPLVTATWGVPGQIIYASADLINTGTDGVVIEVVKTSEIYAPGWNSSFCMGICYLTTVDSTTIMLAPGDTMHFTLDFLTSGTPDSSRVRVGFRNVNFPNNAHSQWFYGTTSPLGIDDLHVNDALNIYPNPCDDQLVLQGIDQNIPQVLEIYDISGRLQKTVSVPGNSSSVTIDVSDLAAGTYVIVSPNETVPFYNRFVKL